MKAKEYEIRSVRDFLAVPEDKIKACLDEFATAIALGRVLAVGVETATGKPPHDPFSCFTWIDDGKLNLNIKLGVV